MSIAVGIILYHQNDEDVINNTQIFISNNQVDKIFIVDNNETNCSEQINKFISNNSEKIIYHAFGSNLGSATALNKLADVAVKNNFDWILTMDQDSTPNDEMINNLSTFVQNHKDINIGMISARPLVPTIENVVDTEYVETTEFYTSGSLMSIKAWQDVGGFEDKLFIDCVDIIYALQLKRRGYKVLTLNTATFKHQLGDCQVKKIAGLHITPTNHNSVRRYYMTRNHVYMDNEYRKEFPAYVPKWRPWTIHEAVRIILCEKNKMSKLRAMWRGVRDAKADVFGKCKYKF